MIHLTHGAARLLPAAMVLGLILSACGGSDSSDSSSSEATSSTSSSQTASSQSGETTSSAASSESSSTFSEASSSSSEDASSSSSASTEASSSSSSLGTCAQLASDNGTHYAVTSTCWYEDFSDATTTTFDTTAYATQTDSSMALYTILEGGDGMDFSNGILTFSGTSAVRFTVGSYLGTTETTADTPTDSLGMFDFSGKNCTVSINAATDQTAGSFVMYANNNTADRLSSPFGTYSVQQATELKAGWNNSFRINSMEGSNTNFLQIIVDSDASASGSAQIDAIEMECTEE